MSKELRVESAPVAEGSAPRVDDRVAGIGFRSKFHTFDSLRDREFRWFWFGMLGSFAAMQMQILARGWLVADKLHGSALDLGIVASSFGLPILLFSPFGGVITDRVRKRNLLIFTQSAIGLATLAIAILVITEVVQIWHIIASSLVTGAIFTFNMPSRQSLISELVAPERLSNAVALNSAGMNINRVAAPALGGVLVGIIGIAGVYFIMVGCYAFVVVSLLRLPKGTEPASAEGRSMIRDLKDGVKYVRENTEVSSLLVLAFAPIVFAMSYQALLPLFAKDILHVGSKGLGVLIGSVGVGAVLGTLGIASLADFQRKGQLMVGMLLVFAVALIIFAFSTNMLLSILALLLVGAGSMGYMALNNTLILTHSEPAMRGRVMSMYMMTWGIAPIGILPASGVAEIIGVSGAVSIGAGLLILAVIAILLWRPQIRNLR